MAKMCHCDRMQTYCVGLVLLAGCVFSLTAATARHREVQYEHFDDYLVSTLGSRPRAFNQVLKVEPGQGQRDRSSQQQPDNSTVTATNDTLSNITADADNSTRNINSARRQQGVMTTDALLGYFRDVPRQHWSCCMLGKLAGNKGFHCYAGFYVERLQSRNRNRVHTARMVVGGHSLLPRYAAGVMRTFERCVENHASEFHKCCYAATLERLEMNRWQRYRDTVRRRRRGRT